jgi:hypothetical protein
MTVISRIKKPLVPEERGKRLGGRNPGYVIQDYSSCPLPFAGIIRIRFIGLDWFLSAETAPLAMDIFIGEDGAFVNHSNHMKQGEFD